MAPWLGDGDTEVGTTGEWAVGNSWEEVGCGTFSCLKRNASVSSISPAAGEKCSQSDGLPAPNADALVAGAVTVVTGKAEADIGGET